MSKKKQTKGKSKIERPPKRDQDLDQWYIDRQEQYCKEAPTPEHARLHGLLLACTHLLATELRAVRTAIEKSS